MLRFFSKMRFNSAAGNRVARYQPNAFGEILFVIISLTSNNFIISIWQRSACSQTSRELPLINGLPLIKTNIKSKL